MEALTASAVRSFLSPDAAGFFRIRTEACVPSTNAALKALARENGPAGAVLIAEAQTAGVGRLGRSFFSPQKTGLYLSVLFRPALSAEDVRYLTPCAAVCAAESIEGIAPTVSARIKWVNDIYIEEKKAAGILTEAAFSGAGLSWAVIGIGIDLCPPEDGFPPELSDTAGTVFSEAPEEDVRPRLAGELLSRLYRRVSALPERSFLDDYCRRSLLDGRRVTVLKESVNTVNGLPALALGITEDCGLAVRYDDGREEVLSSGEVAHAPISVRFQSFTGNSEKERA